MKETSEKYKESIEKRLLSARKISEEEFRTALILFLDSIVHLNIRSVSGPGRSGAIAAVYTSHYLAIPFIPQGGRIVDDLRPHLIIDMAISSGKTLRKAIRKTNAEYAFAIFTEPPRAKFWYESEILRGKM
jgi:hypothetical protein